MATAGLAEDRAMTATLTTPRAGGLRGAIWGTLIGCCAWLVPLAALCVAHGRSDALVEVVLPMALVSLGLGGSVVAGLLCVGVRRLRRD